MRRRRAHSSFIGLLAAIAAVGVQATIATGQAGAATFTVNDPADAVDSNVGDGNCRSFGNVCTLRAAIQESNALPGLDTITILPGTYELEIPTVNDDLDETGDYDVRGAVTFAGTGRDLTIIDGGFPPENNAEAIGMDRLFEIHPTAHRVEFRDLTLREGYVDGYGAAIQNWSSGLIRL
jgi:hypothetical protein